MKPPSVRSAELPALKEPESWDALDACFQLLEMPAFLEAAAALLGERAENQLHITSSLNRTYLSCTPFLLTTPLPFPVRLSATIFFALLSISARVSPFSSFFFFSTTRFEG